MSNPLDYVDASKLRDEIRDAVWRHEYKETCWSTHDGKAFADNMLTGAPRAPEERRLMNAVPQVRSAARQSEEEKRFSWRAASMIRNWWLADGWRSSRRSSNAAATSVGRKSRYYSLFSTKLPGSSPSPSPLPQLLPKAVVSALRVEKLEGLHAWLDLGGSPDSIDSTSCTALHYAVLAPYMAAIELLLQRGGTPNVRLHTNGSTPLLIATIRGHCEAVKALLEAGSDPNIPDKDGHTPLMVASRAGNVELVQLLLQSPRPGIDLEKKDADNRSALWYAVKYEQAGAAMLLRQARADQTTAGAKGKARGKKKAK